MCLPVSVAETHAFYHIVQTEDKMMCALADVNQTAPGKLQPFQRSNKSSGFSTHGFPE